MPCQAFLKIVFVTCVGVTSVAGLILWTGFAPDGVTLSYLRCKALPCLYLARLEGFEPPTHSLEGCCSIQLSYSLFIQCLNCTAKIWILQYLSRIFFSGTGPSSDRESIQSLILHEVLVLCQLARYLLQCTLQEES